MKKLVITALPALALILALAFSANLAVAQEAEQPKIYEVGDDAPEFALPDGLNGETVELSDDILGGKAKLIALTFANTTCSACRAELSLMSSLAEKHDGKLAVYMVAVDMRGEKLVKTYDANFHYKVQYLLDPEFTLPPMFGFTYTPALVLLSPKGEILYKKGGYTPKDGPDLTKEVENRL